MARIPGKESIGNNQNIERRRRAGRESLTLYPNEDVPKACVSMSASRFYEKE
ncbi:MAG TPA: hypothetical protein VEI57_05650 [Nitrospirota bacterium]|nr:hypothetical protein [Nitrospirota bacterium]